MLNNLTQSHDYPGKLFVVEGIDGSGKTTQLGLLAKWLTAEGHRVFVTEWNSSALVKAATKTGKRKNALTPMTFSLLHATDFADRLLYKIIPPLKAGMIVLADRYAFTAFARDVIRGVDRQWVRDLYSFAVRPDLTLYFRVPIDVGPSGASLAGRYYGQGVPYLSLGDGYPGKLIAIEGTDGVGRSTQVQLLREWLEVKGYGVIETGWTRSRLMQPTIEIAKSSNTLNKLTFVLLYATDFADRLEKEIIPALKAGFVVLSDRYIFTALARAGVRGVDRQWLRNLYGFAIAPHMVFYLNIDVKTLIGRILESRGMDFWESGMDLKHGDDIYDSFRTYQNKLLKEYASMADEFHFRVVDARRSIDHIQDELRRQVATFLEPSEKSAEPTIVR